MTFAEFQQAALRTAAMGRGVDFETMVFALGLCGEAAELAEALGGTRETEIKEAGDVLWYLAALAHSLGISAVELGVEELADVASLGYNRFEAADVLTASACKIAEMVKKKIGHKKAPDRTKLIREFQTALTRLATVIDPVGLDEVAEINVAKLKARYPDGWDVKAAAAKPDSNEVVMPRAAPGLAAEIEAANPPNHFRHGTAHFDSDSGEWKPGPV